MKYSRIVTLDATGTLRSFIHNPTQSDGPPIVARWGKFSPPDVPDCFDIEAEEGFAGDFVLAVGRRSGTIELLSGLTGVPLLRLPSSSNCAREGIQSISILKTGIVLAGNSAGKLKMLRLSSEGLVEEKDYKTVPGKLECLSVWRDDNRAAIGNEKRGLCIIDLNTGLQTLGTSQNKASITTITHLCSNCIVVGTANGQLQLNDIRAHKKPIVELSWSGTHITCAARDNIYSCWMGSRTGAVRRWDLKTNRLAEALSGNTGAVTSLHKHACKTLVAVVGSDCWLRVYDTETKLIMSKEYLKQHLNCVRFGPSFVSAYT